MGLTTRSPSNPGPTLIELFSVPMPQFPTCKVEVNYTAWRFKQNIELDSASRKQLSLHTITTVDRPSLFFEVRGSCRCGDWGGVPSDT